MEETIRIRPIDKSNWNSLIQGFSAEDLQDLLEVVSADGHRIGILCESPEGKAYINGEPETAYSSLQAAATALLKG